MHSWQTEVRALRELLTLLEGELAAKYEAAVMTLLGAISAGRKILVCGNGGSCADAAHFAAELSVRYKTDRRALAALALTDAAALTACANDYGYARIFARQVEALGERGDVLVAISTSGRSENVNEAVRRAKFLGLRTLGLSGHRGIHAGCDVDIIVPSENTARIQEAHAFVIHALCASIDAALPKGGDPKWQEKTPFVPMPHPMLSDEDL